MSYIEAWNDPCVFCQIVQYANDPESVVYEDEATLAFINLRQWPRNLGHSIIITRAHYVNLYDLPTALYAPVMTTIARVARAAKVSFGADGITMRQHNERAGSQEVFHIHFHVIPRFTDDDFYNTARPDGGYPLAERHALAARLRPAILDDIARYPNGVPI